MSNDESGRNRRTGVAVCGFLLLALVGYALLASSQGLPPFGSVGDGNSRVVASPSTTVGPVGGDTPSTSEAPAAVEVVPPSAAPLPETTLAAVPDGPPPETPVIVRCEFSNFVANVTNTNWASWEETWTWELDPTVTEYLVGLQRGSISAQETNGISNTITTIGVGPDSEPVPDGASLVGVTAVRDSVLSIARDVDGCGTGVDFGWETCGWQDFGSTESANPCLQAR